MTKVGLFIPTLNAGKEFKKVLARINQQSGDFELRKLIIDSESSDDTVQLAQQAGFEYQTIPVQTFTHGKVRHYAVEKMSDCDYIIFLTQDVYLQKNAIANILHFIKTHHQIAIAYGRQIADVNTVGWLDALDRQNNYPSKSAIKNWKNRRKYGLKTVFSSDAFAIYRRDVLLELGNFPLTVNFSEDMLMAAKAVQKGYSIGYCATAICEHNQKLNYHQLYQRYRKIGEFHHQYPWIKQKFGSANSQGISLVIGEVKFLISRGLLYLIPSLVIRSGIKYLGYKLG